MLYLQPATSLKKRLRHKCFLLNLANFFSLLLYYKRDSGRDVFLWVLWILSSYNFIKSEALPQVFSCEFWGIFQAANFIKNETPAHIFSCEFWEIFQPVTLSKTRMWGRCFLVLLQVFRACNFIKIETPAHLVFSVNFENCFSLHFWEKQGSSASFFLGIFQSF